MTDSIIWVKPDTAVNLDSVAYFNFKQGEEEIVFSTGASIKLTEKDSEALARYLRGAFPKDTRMPTTFGPPKT
jgi:hypothetical protein